MAKSLPDGIIDGLHSYIRQRITGVSVCNAQPTTYAEATSTFKLATTNGLTSTDLALANGDVSGRKITMPAQSALTVDASGTASHVAWWGSSGSLLILVTTCTTQALTTGNTVNIPAHDFEILDVT